MVNVCIFTEAGKHNIGMGHLTRCLGLYKALEILNCSPLLVVHGEESVKNEIPAPTKSLFCDWMYNIEHPLLPHNAAVAIIDSYLATPKVIEIITRKHALTAFMDDFVRLKYPRGVVINGAIFAEEIAYSDRSQGYLLGSQYAPLQEAFWQAPSKKICQSIKEILIAMGGNDWKNLTPSIIELLKYHYPETKMKVLVGSTFLNTDEITKTANKYHGIDLIFNAKADEVKAVMAEVDIAISTAGQMLYELARMGVPTISIQVADNQKNNVEGWLKTGFIEFAGQWKEKKLMENILACLHRLSSQKERKRRSVIGQKWIDGQGSMKIAKKLLQSYFKSQMRLRKAARKDAERLYELSNDDEVRKNSYNQHKILFPEHLVWFEHQMKNPKGLFLIAEANGKLVGQVRFVVEKDAVISISITKEFRSIGMGKLLMTSALKFLKKNHPGVNRIVAYVKNSNMVSKKYFERCDFQFVQSTVIKGVPSTEYHYILRKTQ